MVEQIELERVKFHYFGGTFNRAEIRFYVIKEKCERYRLDLSKGFACLENVVLNKIIATGISIEKKSKHLLEILPKKDKFGNEIDIPYFWSMISYYNQGQGGVELKYLERDEIQTKNEEIPLCYLVMVNYYKQGQERFIVDRLNLK